MPTPEFMPIPEFIRLHCANTGEDTCAACPRDFTIQLSAIEGFIRNPAGKAVDYLLYGLVEGQGGKLDYFWLSDLETLRSPTGLAVVRDPHWQPKMLQEIAPEMFTTNRNKMED